MQPHLRSRRLLIGWTVALLGVPSFAHAQIYSWRDSSGNLVLSNMHKADGSEAKRPSPPGVREARVSERIPLATHLDRLIAEHARLNSVRPSLVRAVVQVESGFNTYARSPKGALGLMQLMPATIQRFKVSNPFNPVDNVRAGVAYLRELLDRYDNNEELALAAYNAGPGAVDKHGQSVPPYRETQNYVSRVGEAAGPESRPAAGSRIYQVIEIVDGREIIRYTNRPQK